MIVGFFINVWEDYKYWVQNDKQIVKRINLLLEDIKRNPYDSNSIGTPERLKENYNGYFSERITCGHRLVYKIVDDWMIIAECRVDD